MIKSNKKKNLKIKIKLHTFNSNTEPKHSVIGERTNAQKTMAKVIFFEYSSTSAPFSRLGSLS